MRAARLWNSSLVLQLNYEAAQHGCEAALVSPAQVRFGPLHCSVELHCFGPALHWSAPPCSVGHLQCFIFGDSAPVGNSFQSAARRVTHGSVMRMVEVEACDETGPLHSSSVPRIPKRERLVPSVGAVAGVVFGRGQEVDVPEP